MTRFPGPLLPQWEGVVNTLSLGWACMHQEMWQRYWHELDMIRNAMTDDDDPFDRPQRFTEEPC